MYNSDPFMEKVTIFSPAILIALRGKSDGLLIYHIELFSPLGVSISMSNDKKFVLNSPVFISSEFPYIVAGLEKFELLARTIPLVLFAAGGNSPPTTQVLYFTCKLSIFGQKNG